MRSADHGVAEVDPAAGHVLAVEEVISSNVRQLDLVDAILALFVLVRLLVDNLSQDAVGS